MTDRNFEGVSIEMLPLPTLFSTLSHAVQQRAINHAHAVAQHNVRFLTHELANAECAIDAEQAGRKKAEARAERLEEALRRQRDWWLASKGEAVSNAPGGLTRIDPGFIALCDAHVQQIDLALRDHDQEVRND